MERLPLEQSTPEVAQAASSSRGRRPVPHKDFSDLYEKMSGEGARASEAHHHRAVRETRGMDSAPLHTQSPHQLLDQLCDKGGVIEAG